MTAKAAHQVLGHAVVGTNELDAATNFYDKLFALFGVGRILEQPGRAVYFGTTMLEFGVINPYNGDRANVGNGNMVALSARSRAHVDEVYDLAIQLGGTDEGQPVRAVQTRMVRTADISVISTATSSWSSTLVKTDA